MFNGQQAVVNNKIKFIWAGVIVVVIAALGAAGYFFWQYHRSQQEVASLKNAPQQTASQETADLVAKVGLLVVLPTGEQPTVATVTDPTKLQDQAFFTNAKVGDKVLLYTKAKKAYLYNPASNKVVEIAPITIGDNTSATKK